jgi:putative ABC transport system substrate-binding protein
MRRREFLRISGGAAVTWPFAAHAQQAATVRRLGVLMNIAEDDREGQSRIVALSQALQTFGWTVGQNLQMDVRWGGSDAESYRRKAAELVALAPDVMLASASPPVMAIQQAAYGGPVVFVGVADPVGAGFVDNLARPGGNVTGFTQFEYGLSAKWLELLRELVPRVSRVAVIRNPAIASGPGQLGALQAVASSLGVELRPVDVRNASELERALNAFVQSGGDGLVATGGGVAVQRRLIVTLAARHRLPAIYPYRYYVVDGGLMSYGPDLLDHYRQAAGYINRILQGETPAALPVQASIKHQLVINLQTAKTLGLTVPPSLLARADEVIE